MFLSIFPCTHKKAAKMDVDHLMDSKLVKAVAVGALVYFGAKTLYHMMD